MALPLIDRLRSIVRVLDRDGSWRERLAPLVKRLEVELVALRHARSFAEVERFAFFIGYPRSGHTLLGALLDAHPDALVAHELNALRLVREGVDARRLYARLVLRDRWFGDLGRRWSGYDYTVPGQWQGRWRRLRVIGDKRGGGTTQELARRPDLLARLRRVVGVPVLAIHHVRDPHDNIASMVTREGRTLEDAIATYFGLVDTALAGLAQLAPDERFELHHDDLVADPRARLAALAARLGLDPDPSWLAACAACVHPTARRSRAEIAWPPELTAEVARRIAAYPHLVRYVRA